MTSLNDHYPLFLKYLLAYIFFVSLLLVYLLSLSVLLAFVFLLYMLLVSIFLVYFLLVSLLLSLWRTQATHQRGRIAGPRSTPRGPCRPWRDESCFVVMEATAQNGGKPNRQELLSVSSCPCVLCSLCPLWSLKGAGSVEALVASQRSWKIEAPHTIQRKSARAGEGERENDATERAKQ